MSQNRKSWDATQGGGAEAAAWELFFDVGRRGALDTHIAADHTAVAFIVDVVNAFETIGLALVWYCGKRHKCPLQLLAPILTVFSNKMVVQYQGSVASTFVCTVTALAAGS